MSDLPWVFDYEDELRSEGATFLGEALLRPVVPVQLLNGDRETQRFTALVDSGADHILTPAWVAQTIGIEPDENRRIGVRIGGKTREVMFQDVTMRLCAPNGGDGCVEWQAQVGFFTRWNDPPWMVILGQVGFFDQFTVVLSRYAQQLAVSAQTDFDASFPPGPRIARPDASPRFRP